MSARVPFCLMALTALLPLADKAVAQSRSPSSEVVWVSSYHGTAQDSPIEPLAYGQQPGGACLDSIGVDSPYCLSSSCVGPECHGVPIWNASAEALFLQRDSAIGAAPIVLDGITSDVLVSTGDLSFDMETGLRLGLGCQLTQTTAVEFGYFGLHEWESTAVVTGANNLSAPGDLGLTSFDFFDADTVGIAYATRIHNAEVNLVRQLQTLELLCGFRFFSLDDQLNINSYDAGTDTASDYNIRTKNDLYGGQLGARSSWRIRQSMIQTVAKAGVFGSDQRQRTLIGDFGNTIPVRDAEASKNSVGFIGELGVKLTTPLGNGLHLLAGYNVLWAEGIALAPDQLDFTNTSTSSQFITSGGAFFHGANVGLEGRW